MITIRYPGGRDVMVAPGATVLEASLSAGIPHAHACGGRGLCSTCRVRVCQAGAAIPAGAVEAALLARLRLPPNVRLACQIAPVADISVAPLLPADTTRVDGSEPELMHGAEIDVTVLFADLRGFSGLAERLPAYDVVFILNQYFALAEDAIRAAGGTLSQFYGDGVMALFGIDGDRAAAAIGAAATARAIERGLADLSRLIGPEIGQDLLAGVGVHSGPAVVGRMGRGRSAAVAAVGDVVNVAARLQEMTKELACLAIISQRVATAAEGDPTLAACAPLRVTPRGRVEGIDVLALPRAA